MEEQQSTNVIEKALQQWRDRELRFSRMFGNELGSNIALLKLQLKELDMLSAQYRNSQIKTERYSLTIVEHQRKLLEKKLYPNPLVRLVRRLLFVPFKTQKDLAALQKKSATEREEVSELMRKHGFGSEVKMVLAAMDQGQSPLSIPTSRFLSEDERLDQALHISKDEDGKYRFEGYTATLHNALEPEKQRSHYFRIDQTGETFTIDEAKNLLAGRALLKDNRWVQFDLNDRDTLGSYRLKEFRSDYGYNLPGVLKQLGVEANSNIDIDDLRSQLESGNKVAVLIDKAGQATSYTIEANPQFRTLNAYDSKLKQVDLKVLKPHAKSEQLRPSETAKQTPLNGNRMRIAK